MYTPGEIFEAFEVTYHSETSRLTKSIGIFSEESVAKSFAKGHGDWGGDADVKPIKVISDKYGNLYKITETIDLDRLS